MTEVRKLSATGLDDYVRAIIKNDDNALEMRKSLIEATAKNLDFIDYIAKNVGYHGTIDLSIDANLKLNEQQFRAPTEQDERALADINIKCTSNLATSPDYWGSVSLWLIENDSIKSNFLAGNPNDTNKKQLKGGYKIDHALRVEKYDDLARYILRSFMGHAKIRNTGVRDFYQFCPVSRAWWRTKLSDNASKLNGLESSIIHRQLTNHRGVWNHISEKGASKLTVISDVKIFSGLTHYLVSENITSEKDCKQITEFIGAQTTWRTLGAFPPAEILDVIKTHRTVSA